MWSNQIFTTNCSVCNFTDEGGFAPMVCLQVCFEVKITKNLPTDFGDDHEEADPHVVRVGWSVDSHGFQLGITNRKNIFNQKELHRYMISIGSGRALFSAIKTTWICYCPKDDSFSGYFFLAKYTTRYTVLDSAIV